MSNSSGLKQAVDALYKKVADQTSFKLAKEQAIRDWQSRNKSDINPWIEAPKPSRLALISKTVLKWLWIVIKDLAKELYKKAIAALAILILGYLIVPWTLLKSWFQSLH